jgi:AraC family transcriptional regulator
VLQSVLKFIDANLDADLSLEALARLSGVLTHQFVHAFKHKVGEAPHHYVLSRRIEAARVLLGKTESPIADIAYATGFSSQSHMTTTFTRELGTTPAQIRSQARD